jgi:thioredoxin reductase (NADPH)
MHLSKYASKVSLVARGDSLASSMSEYLIKEIEAAENVEVLLNTQIVDGGGEGALERLVFKDSVSGRVEAVPTTALFVFIGAHPHTDWLPPDVERDEKGFVITGHDLLLRGGKSPASWSLDRSPLLFETSLAGVFATSDVRHGSVKRVASAVGEGSVTVQMVHEYLSWAVKEGADNTLNYRAMRGVRK